MDDPPWRWIVEQALLCSLPSFLASDFPEFYSSTQPMTTTWLESSLAIRTIKTSTLSHPQWPGRDRFGIIRESKKVCHQGYWKLTRIQSDTGHPSMELQVNSSPRSGSSIEFRLTVGSSSLLIEFLLTQRAIFILGNRNNKSVPGQTQILWQHPKVGWKVIRSIVIDQILSSLGK